jgi:hypothetical protein
MCLFNSPAYIDQLKDKYRKQRKKTIVVYKILEKRDNKLYSPVIKTFRWQIGINQANSRIYKSSDYNSILSDYPKSLHVFLDYKSAKKEYKTSIYNGPILNSIIVKCTAFVDDLIVAESWDKVLNMASFSKIHLSKQEYNKANK